MKKLMHQADQNYLEIHRLRCALRKVSECALSSIQDAGESNNTSQAIRPISSQNEDSHQGTQPPVNMETPNPNRIEDGDNTDFNGTNIAALFEAGGSEFFDTHDIRSMAPSSIVPPSISQEFYLKESEFSAAGGFGLFKSVSASTSPSERLGSSPVIPTLVPVSSHSDRNTDNRSIWNHLATLASSVPQFSSNLQQLLLDPFPETNVEDVLVRAIFQGWDAIPQHCGIDPTWEALRCIDQQILFAYSAVARLAMLYVIKLQLHVR